MIVHDPGHIYELAWLDCEDGNPYAYYPENKLIFVKREGERYPGNAGHHPGTNLQEVMRALIDRVKYLNNQIPDIRNQNVIDHLRMCIYHLECRAAERHGRPKPYFPAEIERVKTCEYCGHMGCNGQCREHANTQ